MAIGYCKMAWDRVPWHFSLRRSTMSASYKIWVEQNENRELLYPLSRRSISSAWSSVSGKVSIRISHQNSVRPNLFLHPTFYLPYNRLKSLDLVVKFLIIEHSKMNHLLQPFKLQMLPWEFHSFQQTLSSSRVSWIAF